MFSCFQTTSIQVLIAGQVGRGVLEETKLSLTQHSLLEVGLVNIAVTNTRTCVPHTMQLCGPIIDLLSD